MGFNSAFKGLSKRDNVTFLVIIVVVVIVIIIIVVVVMSTEELGSVPVP